MWLYIVIVWPGVLTVLQVMMTGTVNSTVYVSGYIGVWGRSDIGRDRGDGVDIQYQDIEQDCHNMRTYRPIYPAAAIFSGSVVT